MEVKTGLKRGDQVFTSKCKKNLKLSKDFDSQRQKWIYSYENKSIITEIDYKCLDLYNSENNNLGTKECNEIESQKWEYDENEHTFKSMGKCLSSAATVEQTEVWAGNLSDGSFAVLLLNKASYESEVEVTWEELGINNTKASVRDLWAKKNLGLIKNGYKIKLKSHESKFLKVFPDSDNSDNDKENNTAVFAFTICSLALVVGFIFFILCYMEIKREKANKNPDEVDNVNSIGKLMIDNEVNQNEKDT